ncbi:hypothetical protein [Kitasatospora sp. NPDC001095]
MLLPVPITRRPHTAEEPTGKAREDLIARYEAGASMIKLARELGHTDDWLRVRFARWGVNIRDRRAAQRLRWERHRANRDAKAATG